MSPPAASSPRLSEYAQYLLEIIRHPDFTGSLLLVHPAVRDDRHNMRANALQALERRGYLDATRLPEARGILYRLNDTRN